VNIFDPNLTDHDLLVCPLAFQPYCWVFHDRTIPIELMVVITKVVPALLWEMPIAGIHSAHLTHSPTVSHRYLKHDLIRLNLDVYQPRPPLSPALAWHYCHGPLTKPKSGQKLGHNATIFLPQTSLIVVVQRKTSQLVVEWKNSRVSFGVILPL
jgi:hypothetical protein